MGELIARLEIGNDVREATTENTSVWHHLGHLAMFDHVYISIDECHAAYVWRDEPHYPDLLKSAVAAKAEIHKNLREVSEQDMDAFLRHHTEDLGNTIPEGWE